MRANRIVMPADLQKETLEQLHTGHQGIQKCQKRAMQSVTISHKDLVTAYALSRVSVSESEKHREEQVENYVCSTSCLPAKTGCYPKSTAR